MVKATKEFFTKYAVFSGRTSRKDYWLATLGIFLLTFVIGFVCQLVFGASLSYDESMDLGKYFSNIGNIIYLVWALALAVPEISISVRRLHDINKSGLWYLLTCVPVVGGLILLVFYLLPSVNEGNKY